MRYRVTYKKLAYDFDGIYYETEILESEEPLSRKEIAQRLVINSDSIVRIEVL